MYHEKERGASPAPDVEGGGAGEAVGVGRQLAPEGVVHLRGRYVADGWQGGGRWSGVCVLEMRRLLHGMHIHRRVAHRPPESSGGSRRRNTWRRHFQATTVDGQNFFNTPPPRTRLDDPVKAKTLPRPMWDSMWKLHWRREGILGPKRPVRRG